MIEITFLGQIVATLAGAVAFVSLLLVVLAGAYVLSTAARGLEGLPAGPSAPSRGLPRHSRIARPTSTIVGLLAFVFLIATTRVGGTAGTLVFAAAVGVLGRSLMLSTMLVGAKGLASLEARRARRVKSLGAARAAAARALEAAAQKRLSGDDLRAEVSDADAAIARLREALGTLVDTRAALGQKLTAGTGGASRLRPEIVRMRDELAARIELGERLLWAAEAAAFRLACAMPIKKLVRRRPAELSALDPEAPGDPTERLTKAATAIDGYLLAIAEARAELDDVATRTPTVPPAAAEEPDEDRPRDPLASARSDLDAIESAYRSLRERAEVTRLGLRAQAGLSEVASAAGEVSKTARAFGLDDRELGLLLSDVARAEQVSSMEPSAQDEDLRTIAEALTRGTSALDRDDRVSVGGVVEALRSIG